MSKITASEIENDHFDHDQMTTFVNNVLKSPCESGQLCGNWHFLSLTSTFFRFSLVLLEIVTIFVADKCASVTTRQDGVTI